MNTTSEAMKMYIKISEAAEKWGISVRRVQSLCADGRIPGAVRMGRDWMIPANTARPADGRTKAARDGTVQSQMPELPFPRKTPFLHITDLYNVPGGADQCALKLEDNPEAKLLFEAEIAYSRGQIDKAYEMACFLLDKSSRFYATISAGMLMALCAIWRGDLELWRRAKKHIMEAPADNDHDRDIVYFAITAVDCMLYDANSFPEWFKIGCFEPLHRDSLPAVRVFYAKYLYSVAYVVATRELQVEGLQGLTLMGVLPNALEPLISHAVADGTVMSELYLRMIAAVIYHTSGNDDEAIRHLKRALPMALADGLYGLLTEYVRTLGPLLEQQLNMLDPQSWLRVKALYSVYSTGWTKLSGSVRGKNLITTLSAREREVAKLAAFGMRNAEIAEKLNISVSGVKQAIRIVSEKSGMSRDEFAAIL